MDNIFPALYHAHHILHQDDLPFWLELARQQGGPILELGCGTGRVLLPVLHAGYSVVGLDYDATMLRFLCSHVPASPRDQAHVFQADMAHFQIAKTFNLILLPCNTLSTLSPAVRRLTLDRVRAHLAPGGIFAASLLNPTVLAGIHRRGEEEIEETFTLPLTGNPVQVSSSWRRSASHFTVTWHYDHLLPDGTVERLTVRVKHSLEPLESYMELLRQAGLKITAVHGDFDGSPYTPESTYLIFLSAIA